MSQHFIDTEEDLFIKHSDNRLYPAESSEEEPYDDVWTDDEETSAPFQPLNEMFGSPIQDFDYPDIGGMYSRSCRSEDKNSISKQSSSDEGSNESGSSGSSEYDTSNNNQVAACFFEQVYSVNHTYLENRRCCNETIANRTFNTDMSLSYTVRIATQVRFADCLVSLTVEDSIEEAQELYAYRKSDVASHLADKQRFNDRICRVGQQISHVFKPAHRYKVWERINNCNDVCDAFMKSCKVDGTSNE